MDEAAKDWTKKLAELSGMWSKQTGLSLVCIFLVQADRFNSYRTQVYLESILWVQVSLSTRLCADLTDVTLADKDSNSIPTDDVNRAIPGNVAMQVAPPGGQN